MNVIKLILFLCMLVSCSSSHRADSVTEITNFTDKLQTSFEPYGKAPDFTWRYLHPEEKYEPIELYIRNNPTSINKKQNKIYISPMGEFSSVQYQIIQETVLYIEAFYGLDVNLLNVIAMPEVPDNKKRKREDGLQYNATFLIDDYLNLDTLKDAAVLIALTGYDLYPKDDWNFVFGMASLQKRVGVWSMKRFGDPLCDSLSYRICLDRTRKVATHEIGHMFSIKHCVRYPCVMNGSNCMEETDVHPLVLCPDCLAKLSWNLNQHPSQHLQRMSHYWQGQLNPSMVELYKSLIHAAT